MTATQAPTPGPLTSESVKLLVKGDKLRTRQGLLLTFEYVDKHDFLFCTGFGGKHDLDAHYYNAFSFIGRPDESGWMPWSGGENPVGDANVEVKFRDGSSDIQAGYEWHWDSEYAPIIAFRLAPTAPVEASGSEEIGDEYEAAAHCVTLAECPPGLFFWNETLGFKSEYGAMEPVGSNFKTWKVGSRADAYCADSGEYFWGGTSNHDDRAKVLVMPIDAATVAMVASHGPAALRPQPSGETRNLEPLADDPAVAALCDSSYRAGALAGWNAANHSDPEDGERIMARIREVESGSLAPIAERNRQRSARPLALGGQS